MSKAGRKPSADKAIRIDASMQVAVDMMLHVPLDSALSLF